MRRQNAAGRPSIAAATITATGDGDGMMEHDDTIGTLFDALDQMKIAENTIVLYTSDNRPHMNTGPDRAMNWPGPRRTPIGKAPSACPA